jgi:hypothetical protein
MFDCAMKQGPAAASQPTFVKGKLDPNWFIAVQARIERVLNGFTDERLRVWEIGPVENFAVEALVDGSGPYWGPNPTPSHS